MAVEGRRMLKLCLVDDEVDDCCNFSHFQDVRFYCGVELLYVS